MTCLPSYHPDCLSLLSPPWLRLWHGNFSDPSLIKFLGQQKYNLYRKNKPKTFQSDLNVWGSRVAVRSSLKWASLTYHLDISFHCWVTLCCTRFLSGLILPTSSIKWKCLKDIKTVESPNFGKYRPTSNGPGRLGPIRCGAASIDQSHGFFWCQIKKKYRY